MNQASKNKIAASLTITVCGMSVVGAGFAVYVIAPRLFGDPVALNWLRLFGLVLIGALILAFSAAWVRKWKREQR